MKVKEIIALMDEFANPDIAMDYDNVGLLIGDPEYEVKKIFVTLDVNAATVKEAVLNNCDMIVSHHPIFFKGVKKINYSTPEGKMIKDIITNSITLFAAHTNMDCAKGGINDMLAELFEMKNVEVLHHVNDTEGIGRVGDLKEPVYFYSLCNIAKEILKTPHIRAAGNMQKVINRICVASGSCSEYIPDAISKNCDAVITGDMKYHDMIDYSERGICIIDAGHYPTEQIVMDIFCKILKNTDIEIIKSKNKDIFTFI